MLKLAPTGSFPNEYVERVQKLEPSWAIAGVRYVFDARVFDAALIPIFSDNSWLDSERFAAMEAGDWPDIPLIAIDVASEFDPSLVAEPEHQVANIQVFVSPDPESGMGEEAVRRARAVIDDLYPEIRKHTLRTEPIRCPPDLTDDTRLHGARYGRRGGGSGPGRWSGGQGQTRCPNPFTRALPGRM